MGLASLLFEKVIEATAEKAFEAAALTAVTTTAIVTDGAVKAVGTVVDGVKSKTAAAQQKKEKEQNFTQYDLDLFYAKVAMCAYIANSDHNLSADERAELNNVLSVAKNIYGPKAVQVAKRIVDNPGTSFMMIEPFLSKVRLKDLDSFLIYAEEMAQIDKTTSNAEEDALGRLRSYIESRRGKKTVKGKKQSEEIETEDNNEKPQPIIELTCPKCGGHLHPDAFGYKASCEHCGYEIILNLDNAPTKELIDAAKTYEAIASEDCRSIDFFLIRPNDKVQFFINNSYIGNIEDVQEISMNFPKTRTVIAMSYGKNYRKRSEVIIPEDGNDYQIYGGRPDSVIYKLYAFPYSLFDDYMNAVYSELTKPKLKKWINRKKNCRIAIFNDHFIFTYAPLFGENDWVRKVKFSKETLALARQLPVRMKDWEKYGYPLCIRKNVVKKFNKATGYALREDGAFTKKF